MLRILALFTALLLSSPSYAIEAAELVKPQAGDRILGSAKAKVTLIEYASLSCPHCANFHTTILPDIKAKFIDTGKVRLIFRDFPLNEPALYAAKLTRCASGDKQYHALLGSFFANQKDWAFEKETFKEKALAIAKKEGLSDKKAAECLANKELEEQIVTSRKDATEKLGVNSTPSFLINGELIKQIKGIEGFTKLLEAAASNQPLPKDAYGEEPVPAQPSLGKGDAKVTVTEYLDIACEHCGQFHNMLLEAIGKDYINTGKAKLVVQELPLSQASFYGFMTARCIGRDSYFPTLARLIEDKNWAKAPAFLPALKAIGEKAGIKKDDFYACLENQQSEGKLTASLSEAEKQGVKSSPTLFINGQRTSELKDVAAIRAAVDDALKVAK